VPGVILLAIKNLPSGVAASDIIVPNETPSTRKGELGTGVKLPAEGLIENALTLRLLLFPAYRNLPAIRMGEPLEPEPPVEKGEPGTSVIVPLALIENADTEFIPTIPLLMYTNSFCA